MRVFREKNAPGDDGPFSGRIEPSLGVTTATDDSVSRAKKPGPQKTQSGVPVLPPVANLKARPNAWARFWAQRGSAPEPPSLASKPYAASKPSPTDASSVWAPAARKTHKAGRSLRILAALFAVATVWFVATLTYYALKFPDPMSAHSADTPTLRILSRNGSLLTERDSRHLYIPIEMLPAHVTNAVVAIEDRRFEQHGGIDVTGLFRAAFANLRAGRYVQGGSTITQQLAKNLYLSPERTLMRKLDEVMLAFWMELRLEKREILELYLNRAYFGGGAYGIEAAAQRHFGKSARALSIVEGAIIAGLLKAPSRYSPTSNPAAARRRGRVVLNAMKDAGLLQDGELANALKQPVRFAKDVSSLVGEGSDYATDLILERMPEVRAAHTDTIIVETTIDSDLQKLAQRKLAETLARDGARLKAAQGAIVVLDSSGGIRALVGGVDHASSQFNRATMAERQPGSAFKPFVYLTALESGMTPETVANDQPLNIQGWSPRNADGGYRGEVTLRDALAASINTVAVRLALDVTPAAVAATARRAGISSELREDASLALGTSEVNLLDLTGAYTMFANGGRKVEPHVIRRILSSSGRVLYANASENTTAVADLRHVGAMNDMLNAALVAGTGRKAALATHPAAGKTGTSQDFRDAWFVGYTAHMTAGIWLGNDDGKPMNRVVGGSVPAGLWHSVMSEAHKPLPPRPLPGTYRPGQRTAPRVDPQVARVGSSKRTSAAAQVAGYAARRPAVRPSAGSKLSPTRMRIAPAKTGLALRETIATSEKHLAPTMPPPLPTLHRKPQRKRVARPQHHPRESISPDFIAQAIDGVPPGTAAAGNELARGATRSSGFDLEDIRRRLKDAPASSTGRTPYMALGASQTSR